MNIIVTKQHFVCPEICVIFETQKTTSQIVTDSPRRWQNSSFLVSNKFRLPTAGNSTINKTKPSVWICTSLQGAIRFAAQDSLVRGLAGLSACSICGQSGQDQGDCATSHKSYGTGIQWAGLWHATLAEQCCSTQQVAAKKGIFWTLDTLISCRQTMVTQKAQQQFVTGKQLTMSNPGIPKGKVLPDFSSSQCSILTFRPYRFHVN